MTQLKLILIFTTLILSTIECKPFINIFKYKDTSVRFIESLLNEDYDKAIDYMAIDRKLLSKSQTDTIKWELTDFRNVLVKQFGTDLNYSFMKAEKVRSTDKSENTPEGITDVYIQYSNKDYFGVFKIAFDDASDKIWFINILEIKKLIPPLLSFWLRGLFALLVPIFNIYMIVQIRRSNLTKKWIKYIAIILLNVPTIGYSAINGYYLDLLQFQFFGFGFGLSGYLNYFLTIGVPIGSLWWLWRLNVRKRLSKEPDTAYSNIANDNLNSGQ